MRYDDLIVPGQRPSGSDTIAWSGVHTSDSAAPERLDVTVC